MREFLRRHLWIVFLAHQLLIFTLAVGFLTSVRKITGRTIHGGRDPIGRIDGAALILLSVVVIAIMWALYHWIKGRDAPSLGLKPSAWHAGGVVSVGWLTYPKWSSLLLMLVTVSMAVALSRRHSRSA